jgi:hypothetical protein
VIICFNFPSPARLKALKTGAVSRLVHSSWYLGTWHSIEHTNTHFLVELDDEGFPREMSGDFLLFPINTV